ncbi:MAG: 16S rRNA (cytosine(967)-C(5))-methyltransferase RsmB [Deltaproteobacteria bacterium]|nr:16S rRNA (cytosine(967)-C(5))-methyltransferase RsmB [Deltaproteobacteria bacterium]
MPRSADARALALQVLLRVERQQAYLNLTLASVLDTAGDIDRRDAALATELCYGVYRRLLALDAAIAAHADRSLQKLEAVVLAALRLGAYQLLYLDRVPERAAVAATVELVKKERPRAAGFVNAILRAISRERTVPLPDAQKDFARHLSIRESHPRWLVERFLAQLGPTETEALLVAHNKAPAIQVRANVKRANRDEVLQALKDDGVTATPTTHSPVGMTLVDPGPLEKLASYKRGLWQVQDEAAQCVGFLARPAGGARLLDGCAAPGGKACHLLERMDAGAKLLAVDLHQNKLGKIHAEAQRLGLADSLELRAHDLTTPLAGSPKFDRVLIDAPCTGLGTLRRHPELRYRREPQDIARLAELQASILRNVATHVAPGGLLTYAVCSVTPEEGSQQIEKFLAEAKGFSRVGGEDLPASVKPLVDEKGQLSTWPHRHEADGFWAATLRRD